MGTAVRRHCTDWYEIWALTDHEIYYIKIELDLRKFSNGPFSETEKGFWVIPTPGGSQCTGVSPTLSWKWPRATLSPSFGHFFRGENAYQNEIVSTQNYDWLHLHFLVHGLLWSSVLIWCLILNSILWFPNLLRQNWICS